MAGSAVIGTLRAILSLDTADFESASVRVSQAAKGWTKDLKSMGSQATAIGGSLTTMLTLPILGVGYAAVEAGASFEQTMNQVAAVTNSSAEDMAKLSAAATEWGAKTKFSNREAAEAMLELGKAGFTAEQTIAALPSTLQLATAANMGLGEAAQMTSNVMNTFGLEAKDLAHSNDILTEAANRSTIDVADLRESLKFVGPVAKIAGVSLADVAAASAVLGQNGIKAEMAGTGLRGMLATLLSPTKDTAALLNELGFQAEVAAGKTVNWTSMLDALKTKFGEGKDSADQFAGMVMEAFGKRAGPAVIALAQEGGASIKQMSGEFDAASGSAAKMSDAFMKGLPGAMEVAKGSIETMFASIETAIGPTLEKILIGVAKVAGFIADTVIPAFNALPEPVKMAGVVFLGLVAAIGPFLIIVGQVLTGASAIAAAFTTTGIATTALSAVLPALGAAFTVLTGPIGLILAAIVGLGLAWMKWGDDVTGYVSSAFAAVKEWLWDRLQPVIQPLIPLIESVGAMFEAFGRLVGAVVEKVYTVTESWIGQKFVAVFNGMVAVVKFVVDTIGKILGMIPDYLLPLLGPIGAVVLAFRHWDEITKIAQAVYTGVKTWLIDKFAGIVQGVKDKIDAVTGFFNDMYEKVVGHSFVPDMISAIGTEFGKLNSVMVQPTQLAAGAVTGIFRQLETDTTTTMGQIASIIGERANGIAADLTGIFTDTANTLTGIGRDFITTFANIMIPGLGSVISALWPIVQKGLGKIWDGIKAFGSAVGGFFKGLFGGEGVKTNDRRDDLKRELGGDAAGRGLDELLEGNTDPTVNAAYDTFMTTGNRGDLEAAAAVLRDAVDRAPQFDTGSGGWRDFGRGTLAMLHGIERVDPKPVSISGSSGAFGGGEMRIIFEQDGRSAAEFIAPYLPDVVRRFRLA